jgi:hypothetical protein
MRGFAWLAMTAILVSIPSYAASWFPLTGAEGIEVHVDANSVAPAGAGLIKAWVRHSYAETQNSRGYPPFSYKSSIQLYLFNCSERTMGTIQDAFYSGESGQGDSVNSNTYSRKNVVFSDVIPGTIGEGTLEFSCGWMKRKNKK